MGKPGRSDRHLVAEARAAQLAAGTKLSTREIAAHLKSEGTPLRRQDVVRIAREERQGRVVTLETMVRRAMSTPTKYLRGKYDEAAELAARVPKRPPLEPPIPRLRHKPGETPQQFRRRQQTAQRDALRSWQADWQRWQSLYTPAWLYRQELIRRGLMEGTLDISYAGAEGKGGEVTSRAGRQYPSMVERVNARRRRKK